MKRQLLWTLLILATVSTTQGQIVLKKKELKERIDQISTDIQNKDFEKAMTLFDSKQEIIQEDNVPKKSLDKYKTIKTTLKQKKKEFAANKEKVNSYQRQYNSKDYCSPLDLLGLSLTKENSYQETQDIQSKLTAPLRQAKQKCEDNNSKLTQWKKDYQNKEYEKLYQLLDIGYSEKNYFYQRDLTELETLQQALIGKYSVYKNVKDKMINAPDLTINSIDFNTLTYKQSEQYIKELKSVLSVSNAELQKPEGNNPILTQEFAKLKSRIESRISELHKFSEEHRPLSLSEIHSAVSLQKPITLDFLGKNCHGIDGYSCSMYGHQVFGGEDVSKIVSVEYATKELWAANNLDVFSYFKLNEQYDTELKRKAFKSTSAYTDSLTKLKQVKQDHRQTVFVIELGQCAHFDRNHRITEYNLSKKRFEINIGGASCFTTPHTAKLDKSGTFSGEISNVFESVYRYRPPKTIYDFDVSKLPISQKVESKMLFTFYAEYIQVPVSEQIALKIENNKEDISIYIVTDITGVKQTTYNKYWYMPKDNERKTIEVFTNSFVRLIIANNKTGEIHFDKTYK